MKNISLLFVCVLTYFAFGQDPHFSQYNNSPLLLNPANAGLNNDLRALINYRQQWRSVANPFKTAGFSFDANVTKDKYRKASLGIGIQLINDQSGDAKLNLNQGNLNISSVIRLDEYSKLSVGLMGGFGTRSINYSSLRWESQYQNGSYNATTNSGENLASSSFSYMDAGAGIAWSYGKDQGYITQNNGVKLTVGLSAFHFGIPKTSFIGSSDEKLNTKYIFHARGELGKQNTNLTFIPELVFVQQSSLREIILGNTFRYLLKEGSHFTGFTKSSAISLGINYRVKDALIASFGVDYGNFSVYMGYDITMSKLSAANKGRGGFEIALKFVTPNPFSRGYRSRI
jgi:type IX secretion system PorP/SprF family membrane protein